MFLLFTPLWYHPGVVSGLWLALWGAMSSLGAAEGWGTCLGGTSRSWHSTVSLKAFPEEIRDSQSRVKGSAEDCCRRLHYHQRQLQAEERLDEDAACGG